MIDIYLYGLDHWGDDQAATYQAALEQAYDHLCDHPRMGVARDHLMRGLRRLSVEHHEIYYRVTPGEIDVVRILHERMDAASHLRTRRT